MTAPGTVYLSIKLARRLFDKPLEALAAAELARVELVAKKQGEIEALILATYEAAQVLLPESSVAANVQEIRGRYASDDEYQAELERLGLDADSLQQSVKRDMVVEAVLDKVSARAAMVSDTEVEIFWFMHKDRFKRNESRVMRHILITINDNLAGNERNIALEKIQAIRERLLKAPARFAEQALKHSECPTAMNGGVLGTVNVGQLYPELDAAAFAMSEGAISEVVETEMGFHILLCERISPAHLLPYDEAEVKIRAHLEQQRRSVCQKSWINVLRRQNCAVEANAA